VACLTSEGNKTPIPENGVTIKYAIASEGMQLVEGEYILSATALR
jgi:hypothetical protein